MGNRVIIHKYKNDVSGRRANLRSNARTAGSEKDGFAPTRIRAAAHDATASLGTHNKGRLDHVRENGDCFGTLQQIPGNSLVGGLHDLVEHLPRFDRLLGRFLYLCHRCLNRCVTLP
jgi:hypothetical protein